MDTCIETDFRNLISYNYILLDAWKLLVVKEVKEVLAVKEIT